jgi:hypothetical protein
MLKFGHVVSNDFVVCFGLFRSLTRSLQLLHGILYRIWTLIGLKSMGGSCMPLSKR